MLGTSGARKGSDFGVFVIEALAVPRDHRVQVMGIWLRAV